MDFHIGTIIKRVALEKRMGPTELGVRINTSKQNVYGIYNRKSIDTRLLAKISIALNHDFFLEYVQLVGLSSLPVEKVNGESRFPELPQLRERISSLETQVGLLKRVNSLLEDRINGNQAS